MFEVELLWIALLAYVLAGSAAIIALVLRRNWEGAVLGLALVGLLCHTGSLGVRWASLGHGPFITLFEILSSNIWSLMLAFVLAYWRLPAIRASAAVVMPVLFLMMGWLLTTSPKAGHFPPTYHTAWLFIHIGFGKVFLGAVLVAVGLAGVILLRRGAWGASRFQRLPANDRLDELGHRCLAIGFIFETLMLIAGAIWAQDAWGRYWAWDPLETWAFVTWLTLAFALHARGTYRLAPAASSLLVMAVFAIAFLTFFGVPFVSTAPHKGAV